MQVGLQCPAFSDGHRSVCSIQWLMAEVHGIDCYPYTEGRSCVSHESESTETMSGYGRKPATPHNGISACAHSASSILPLRASL